jgi:membrane protein DedA with SNARE-associated domain
MFTLTQVIVLLSTYGYLLIFPIALVEGPIITIISGWLSALGILNFFVAYLVLITANVLGDLVYYLVGYWGGPVLIKKWGHWLHLDLEQTAKLKNHFDNHGGKILITTKIVPHFAASAALVGAGLAKYRLRLFLRYCFFIEIIKTAILMSIGYFVGDAYQKIVVYFDYVGAIISIIVAVAIVVGFYYWRKKQRKKGYES